MTADGHESSTRPHAPRPGDRWTAPLHAARAPHRRRRTHLLPALAGIAVAAALVGGCGTNGAEAPDEEAGTDAAEQTSAAEDSAEPTSAAEDEGTDDGEDDSDDGADDRGSGDSGSDDGGSDDGGDDAGRPAGENLFEGSWGFGHDEKALDAEELADLLEEEAEARGPEEMSVDVECEDGVDTSVPDDTAECTAYADEGVEHAWRITAGPADAGLVIEVENTD